MSRGVVLWLDAVSRGVITSIWQEMASRGIPSQATHTHRLHQPHVSLAVAEQLPVEEALGAVGPVPSEPIALLIESVGVFRGGVLFLACVPSHALLNEQRRIHHAVGTLLVGPWPHFEPGTWTPHVTMGWDLTSEQQARALPMVLDRLPIEGWLDHGGVEDGTTGQSWPAPADRRGAG